MAAGDSFEVFAAYTLGSLFGTTPANLVLIGGLSIASADSVVTFGAARNPTYFYSTTTNYWQQYGTTGNFNNTIIAPYSAFVIGRHQNSPATSFSIQGHVAEVNHLVRVNGGVGVYNSTGYPVKLTLGQLQLGSNWAKAPVATPNLAFADSLSLWNALANRFDTYFELSDNTWRLQGDLSGTDKSSFSIPAGTTVSFLKRASASGAQTFLVPQIPYQLTH